MRLQQATSYRMGEKCYTAGCMFNTFVSGNLWELNTATGSSSNELSGVEKSRDFHITTTQMSYSKGIHKDMIQQLCQ